jgi:hypothetical protein
MCHVHGLNPARPGRSRQSAPPHRWVGARGSGAAMDLSQAATQMPEGSTSRSRHPYLVRKAHWDRIPSPTPWGTVLSRARQVRRSISSERIEHKAMRMWASMATWTYSFSGQRPREQPTGRSHRDRLESQCRSSGRAARAHLSESCSRSLSRDGETRLNRLTPSRFRRAHALHSVRIPYTETLGPCHPKPNCPLVTSSSSVGVR